MEIEAIKNEILKIYPNWKALGGSLDEDKYAEIYESCVRDLLNKLLRKQGLRSGRFSISKTNLG